MEDRGYDVTADFYKRLGVNVDAPQEVLNASYRALAKKYHPDIDKSEGAEKRYKDVQDAYDYLCDEKRRADYNSWLSSESSSDSDAYLDYINGNSREAKSIQRAMYKASATKGERVWYRVQMAWYIFLKIFYFLVKTPFAIALLFWRFLCNCVLLPIVWLVFKFVMVIVGMLIYGGFGWLTQKNFLSSDYQFIPDFIFNHGNVVYPTEIIGLLIVAFIVSVMMVWDSLYA